MHQKYVHRIETPIISPFLVTQSRGENMEFVLVARFEKPLKGIPKITGIVKEPEKTYNLLQEGLEK